MPAAEAVAEGAAASADMTPASAAAAAEDVVKTGGAEPAEGAKRDPVADMRAYLLESVAESKRQRMRGRDPPASAPAETPEQESEPIATPRRRRH